MPGLANEKRIRRARVVEVVKVPRTKASKLHAQCLLAGMKVVAEQYCMGHAKHTAQIVQFEGDLHELERNL